MSSKHPIIAVTGSSGAGTTSVRFAFEQIFNSIGITPAIVPGDGFHRYDRHEMDSRRKEMDSPHTKGSRELTHFGHEGNLFEELGATFKEYSKTGSCRRRFYIHDQDEAFEHGAPVGSLTAWEKVPENTDLLFYEGLHGGLITGKTDIAKYVDLLIGVTPIINLEWIQKIHRDGNVRGYSVADSVTMILDRMQDYVKYIIPQFSHTDINFQRIPTVDTANPFDATQAVPSRDESMVVVHIRNSNKINADFHFLLEMLGGAFMSAPDTIVIPGGKIEFCMKLLLTPTVKKLMAKKKSSI
ncbi:MAG: phosphoribulokinase [Candidatus Porifericomitaceae bacterium WSBS_2022_MAG_OTU9]